MTRNCAETCGYCAEAIAVLGDDLIKGDGGPSGGGGGVTQPGGDVTQPGGGGAVTTTAAPVLVPTDAPAKGKLGPKCVDRQANCLAFVNFYRGDCWSDSSEFLRPMCPKVESAISCIGVRRGVSKREKDGHFTVVSGVGRLQGVEGSGLAGLGETLGTPWPYVDDQEEHFRYL
jgi:hypothetical protein